MSTPCECFTERAHKHISRNMIQWSSRSNICPLVRYPPVFLQAMITQFLCCIVDKQISCLCGFQLVLVARSGICCHSWMPLHRSAGSSLSRNTLHWSRIVGWKILNSPHTLRHISASSEQKNGLVHFIPEMFKGNIKTKVYRVYRGLFSTKYLARIPWQISTPILR